MHPFHEWILDLIETAEPVRRRDLLPPYQVGGSIVNWSNKARYLPKRNLALRAIPVFLLLILLSGVFSATLNFFL